MAGHPYVRSVLLRGGKNISRCILTQQSLKEKYDSRSAAKWNAAYNGLFASILAAAAAKESEEPPVEE